MEFNQYQIETRATAVYRDKPGTAIVYPALGLGGEAGEVNRGRISQILGECLFCISTLATEIGYSLGRIAAQNLSRNGQLDK